MNIPLFRLSGKTPSRLAPWMIAAILLLTVDCAPLEQAEPPGNLPVIVGTRVFIAPGLGMGDCSALVTDEHWTLTKLEGFEAGKVVSFSPTQSDFQPGAMSDEGPLIEDPGWCIFRSKGHVTEGHWVVEAQLTFQGTAWSATCEFDPQEDSEPCHAQDWVGFTAQGFLPAGQGCEVRIGDSDTCGEEVGTPLLDFWPAPGG